MDNRSTREILEDMEEESFYVWIVKCFIKLIICFICFLIFIVGFIVSMCYMCSD